jgi:hypothetical protein
MIVLSTFVSTLPETLVTIPLSPPLLAEPRVKT